MEIFSTDRIRNVALAGHGGTGKTTLLDQMLYNAGVIQKAENPESGKTISDYTEEEIEKKMSIYATLSHFTWQNNKMNILDTPGSADFIGEVICAFRAAESAIMLIGARSSVQIETIKLWRRLEENSIPRAVFVNKMDKDRADFEAVVQDLNSRFKKTFVPVTLPIGSGPDYKGIINLIEMKAYLIHDKFAKDTASAIPEDLLKHAEEIRFKMIELAAEGDDTLIEKYFNSGTLSEDDIKTGLTLGMRNNRVIPVLCGSADKNNGIASLLNFISTAAPSPIDIHETALDVHNNLIEIKTDNKAPMSAFSFKTKLDAFSGKISVVKVITGKLHPEMEVFNSNQNKRDKIHKIYICQGKKIEEVTELFAGDIGLFTKLSCCETNETLCDPTINYRFKELKLPQPVYSVAVSCENKKDEDKLAEALHKSAEQDLTFRVRYNNEIRQTVVSAMGEMHANMILDMIRAKQKITITTEIPRIAYRETITTEAEAEYTHKKQSGGHGQYGKVMLKIQPTERSKFFEFENAIKGGSISKGYMPGIEKGLLEGMEHGFIAGYPMVDLKVTILDGKEHPVDSSEMSFKLAAKGALKEAVSKAKPVLLEPIMFLKVFIEEAHIGDVLSDLSTRRAKVLKQDAIGGGFSEIDAEVPQSELLSYSIDLKAMTSGTGAFEVEFTHYSPLLGKLAEQIITEVAKHTHETVEV